MDSAISFDLDGTITTEEILPRLAREVDLFDEIRILTEATLKGELPFQRSFELRCKLLSDIPLSQVRQIIQGVDVNHDIASFIRANSERCFVVTGNLDVWVEPLLHQLGCRAYTSKAAVDGDRLLGVAEILNKGSAVNAIRKTFSQVIAVGDGMNDASMFEAADIGIAFGGVHEPVPALVDVSRYVVTDGRSLCRLLSTL